MYETWWSKNLEFTDNHLFEQVLELNQLQQVEVWITIVVAVYVLRKFQNEFGSLFIEVTQLEVW